MCQKSERTWFSGSMLNKHGFRMVFESDKVILSKSRMYVGKGYVTDGLFKLNVMTIIDKDNKSSVCLLESSNLWHGRLGHVNYDTLRRLINLDIYLHFKLIQNINVKFVLRQN